MSQLFYKVSLHKPKFPNKNNLEFIMRKIIFKYLQLQNNYNNMKTFDSNLG